MVEVCIPSIPASAAPLFPSNEFELILVGRGDGVGLDREICLIGVLSILPSLVLDVVYTEC